MAPSAAVDLSTSQIAEKNLQPFFVLHKGSPKKSDKKSAAKTRRRIDLPPSLPKTLVADTVEGCDDQQSEKLRMETFDFVWSKIESTIKDVLRDINVAVFSEIDHWVHESFDVVRSCGIPDLSKPTRSYPIVTGTTSKQLFTGLDVLRDINVAVFSEIDHWVHESFDVVRSCGIPDLSKPTRSYPIVTGTTCKQLFTGLVFTRNMEFVDDLQTFTDLSLHLKTRGCHVANLSSFDFSSKNGIGGCLKSLLRQFLTVSLDTFTDLSLHLKTRGCHVANLSSFDFSSKNGIGGCLKSLLRQFLMVSLDAADISILASWYCKQGNYEKPVVVIISDMGRCCRSVLSDFILMLSEWVLKIPVILMMGVATTVDAPRNVLPSNVLQYLSPCKFTLGSPSARVDAVVEAVLVKQCSGFAVGHKVATFMRNYFVRQDGTLSSFVRALKMAIVQHFFMEPSSFILVELFSEEDSQVSWSEKRALLPEIKLKRAISVPSYGRTKIAELNTGIRAHGLAELKRLQKLWSSLCLYEAGKYHKITMLDIYCEALDPELYNPRASHHHTALDKDLRMTSSDQCVCGQYPSLCKGGIICQAIRRVRDLPPPALCQLLKSWENLTKGVNEINEKVKELQSLMKLEDNKCLKQDLTDISKRDIARSSLNLKTDAQALNEKAASFIGSVVRDYLQPIECMPYHEMTCFKNVDKLQSVNLPQQAFFSSLKYKMNQSFHSNLTCRGMIITEADLIIKVTQTFCVEAFGCIFSLRLELKLEDKSLMLGEEMKMRREERNWEGKRFQLANDPIFCLLQSKNENVDTGDAVIAVQYASTAENLALIGDPRRRVQIDLLESSKILKCGCCRKIGSTALSSMHDTSIMYTLSQEHGDLINLHDWYQSFTATILHSSIKVKHRLNNSPSPKKRKCTNEPPSRSEATVQARFCRAVTELQITGLLRMPGKRRPDYLQRVAFGL
ncbi:unnamed protein product [Ilex paraguariensis]|uniref:Origin of replication complex subunit 3 n=1 Tax=Ilex paraguariensis TaxID=185542 RepID=A0ABC8TDK5_9AQUA